jgi:hypothetical protein
MVNERSNLLTLLQRPFNLETTLISFPLAMETYNSKEVSRIAGVFLRQIQYRDGCGFLRPPVKAAQRRGSNGFTLSTTCCASR